MITNNSYIRSDYGIINKNIIAQTKLNEYDKETNKNFLTTKEYVDSKINNEINNLCYSVEVPYIHTYNSLNPYYGGEDYHDVDGKYIMNDYKFITNKWYLLKDNDEYYLFSGISENDGFDIDIKKTIKMNIGQRIWCKSDNKIYYLISFLNNYDEYDESITYTYLNILIPNDFQFDLTQSNTERIKLKCNPLEFTNFYHIIELGDNIINGSNDINLLSSPDHISMNDVINHYFPNNTIYNIYFKFYFNSIYTSTIYFPSGSGDIKYFLKKKIVNTHQILNFLSYSGIPKITINNNPSTHIDTITLPGLNSQSITFNLTNYQNIKDTDFYQVLIYNNDFIDNNINYSSFTAYFELNNNGTIETNTINIKYNNTNYNYTDNNSIFETQTNISFILIDYKNKNVLVITNNNNSISISKYNNNDINETNFYKDLNLLSSLNITNIIDDTNNNLNIYYKLHCISSQNEQRIKNWEIDNNKICLTNCIDIDFNPLD